MNTVNIYCKPLRAICSLRLKVSRFRYRQLTARHVLNLVMYCLLGTRVQTVTWSIRICLLCWRYFCWQTE